MANFLKGTLLFSRLYECVIHRLSFIISQVYYLVRKNTFLNAFKAFFFKKNSDATFLLTFALVKVNLNPHKITR